MVAHLITSLPVSGSSLGTRRTTYFPIDTVLYVEVKVLDRLRYA